MQWEVEAEEAIKRVPVFVRKMVRRKVEEYAADKGCASVTLIEVQAARQAFKGGRPEPQTQEKISFEDGNVTSEKVQALESLSEERGVIKAAFSILKVCGAPFGCPRQVVNPGPLMERLAKQIEASGYPEFLEERVEGPILTHHKFRVALSGCPNACSQPQIQDFGVIGRVIPDITDEPCTECMECVAACNEDSIQVLHAEPIIDFDKCVGCGDCAKACPTGTLVAERRGYSIVIGGKLGRHPQFAQEVVHLASEDEVEAAFQACLDLYMRNARGAERFTFAFNRLGLDAFRRAIEEAKKCSRIA